VLGVEAQLPMLAFWGGEPKSSIFRFA